MEDADAKLAQANDMIQVLASQRNSAQNEIVQLGAQLLAAQRKIKELEAKLENQPELSFAKSNGASEAVAAH